MPFGGNEASGSRFFRSRGCLCFISPIFPHLVSSKYWRLLQERRGIADYNFVSFNSFLNESRVNFLPRSVRR